MGWTVRGSISSNCEKSFSLPKCPDPLWDLTSLPYRFSFSGIRRAGREAGHQSPSSIDRDNFTFISNNSVQGGCFKSIVPVNADSTVRCTDSESTSCTKRPYSAPRPELKGPKKRNRDICTLSGTLRSLYL